MPAAKKRSTAVAASARAHKRQAGAPTQFPQRSEDEPSALTALKQYTTVVADTGDFDEIEKFSPQDATTNPTLLLKAANKPEYAHLLDKALEAACEVSRACKEQTKSAHDNSFCFDREQEAAIIEETVDRLFVLFGVELLRRIPGVVSTEVSAAFSFDIEGSVQKARKLISLYEEEGVSRERVLIKLACTWEGCEAAKILERENIHCNMTLLFSFAQALAAAEAKVTLISPFVGRILDWHKQQDKLAGATAAKSAAYEGEDDPGVQRVKRVYRYYKRHQFKTLVMGASFRNIGEVICLAGCDKLTVSPALLAELEETSASCVSRQLYPSASTAADSAAAVDGVISSGAVEDAEAEHQRTVHTEEEQEGAAAVAAVKADPAVGDTAPLRTEQQQGKGQEASSSSVEESVEERVVLTEKEFRWALNEDALATEKLAEGIRNFYQDFLTLKHMVSEKLQAKMKTALSEEEAQRPYQ